MDQCAAEQLRERSVRGTPSTARVTPRGLSLAKLHLKGGSETTVKIVLQKKHWRGETLICETVCVHTVTHKAQGLPLVLDCVVGFNRFFMLLSACLYSGKTYSHGDVWHPVLGKVLECILCTCRDGLQDCKRITCPGQYPCNHPMKTEGKCCKICPGISVRVTTTQYCF